MITEQRIEPTYSKEEIKEAIRAELTRSDFMGDGKERYYTIMGIVMAALEYYDGIKTTK